MGPQGCRPCRGVYSPTMCRSEPQMKWGMLSSSRRRFHQLLMSGTCYTLIVIGSASSTRESIIVCSRNIPSREFHMHVHVMYRSCVK